MCGRYVLRNTTKSTHTPWTDYARDIALFAPRYNIAPTQPAPVIYHDRETGQKHCDLMPWGFRPHWSKYQPSINARAEGLLASKMFKGSARHHRCLVVADGFYEPKGPSGQKKRPWHFFEYRDHRLFAMAGIWVAESGFAIITAEPNAEVAPVHDRMPLIIPPEEWRAWLDPMVQSDGDIAPLLVPTDYPGMVHYRVGDRAKRPGNEGPDCIQPKD